MGKHLTMQLDDEFPLFVPLKGNSRLVSMAEAEAVVAIRGG